MSKKGTFDSISNLMDGYNPHREILEQTRQLVQKWEPTGLLEGIEDEHLSAFDNEPLLKIISSPVNKYVELHLKGMWKSSKLSIVSLYRVNLFKYK